MLDIADAFHNIRIRPSECRYAVAKVGDQYVVFQVLCMGGKSSPTIWGRFAACVGRIFASVADPWCARIEVYVDDPLTTVGGDV